MKLKELKFIFSVMPLLTAGGCMYFADVTSREVTYPCNEDRSCVDGFKCAESLKFTQGECLPVCATISDCGNFGYCLDGACHAYSTLTVDGKTYKTVVINNKEWMAENLATKQTNGGSAVTCYADIEQNPQFIEQYGCLYDQTDAIRVCPAGWHLPSEEEFQNLIAFAGGDITTSSEIPAKRLRDKSFHEGENTYGFSALPAGYRYAGRNNVDPFYDRMGDFAYFCSTGSPLKITWMSVEIEKKENISCSVRCIKD